ncbi:MAG: heat-inducible transcriptional repressor HrcA [Gammaproteobacteria bacterium]|nr:heat-inducible transcriptional repressor HrcA [Gammaproteobacteria bacterium]
MNDVLSERAETLLKRLIQLYIVGGQPVGSRTLAKEARLDLSPATIRNVMSDLEELGLIQAPHTSAGRIPTQKGYRLFVDSLLKVKPLNRYAVREIEERLAGEMDPKVLLTNATNILSQITRFAGVILIPGQDNSRFRQIEFLKLSATRVLTILVTEDGRVQNRVIPTDREYSESELIEAANFFNAMYTGSLLGYVRRKLLNDMQSDSDEMHRITRTALAMAGQLFASEEGEGDEVMLSGEANLLNVPDFCQLEKLQALFDAFKTKHDLLDLLDRSMKANGISIFIGDESGYQSMHDCSLVAAPYDVDGEPIGTVGVIGPTRMAYAEVIPIVDVTARLLSGALSSAAVDGPG